MAAKKKGWPIWAQHSKPQNDENTDEDLLVFGYSCKLFRDDEKALHIDQGKHLIPWMGDDTVMIDRYDGRGYLHELSCYEAKEGQDTVLGEEDMKLEEACEEERWMALKKDMAEEEMYQEEEMKRLRAELAIDSVYKEVGFSYNDTEPDLSNSEPATEVRPSEPPDADFVAPAELCVPDGMAMPKTAKVNAIVEKTALFISKNGPQMEIVIKTKQANNPQFDFLVFDHELNRYYRHMMQAIKSGKYIPKPQESRSAEGSEGSDGDSDGEHYLHPSLLSKHVQPEEVTVNIPKINYTRREDDLYARLVNQLKDKLANSNTSANNATSYCQPQENNSSAAAAPTSYLDLTVLYNQPPPPGLEPMTKVQLPGQGSSTPSAAQKEIVSEPYLVPPAEVQPIIDKMAVYVAKNGLDFEAIVRNKGDGRFEFLNPWHEYHGYYQLKRRESEERMAKEQSAAEATRLAQATAAALNRVLAKEQSDRAAAAGPISFSIRPKDGENSDRRKSVLSGGSDSDNDEGKTHSSATTEEKFILKADPSVPAPPPPRLIVIDSKQAEEIRARILASAREKLNLTQPDAKEKEKQLQLERKRKAMLFLSKMLKKEEKEEEAAVTEVTADSANGVADDGASKEEGKVEEGTVAKARAASPKDGVKSGVDSPVVVKKEGSREKNRGQRSRDRDRVKEREKSKERDKERDRSSKDRDKEKVKESEKHKPKESRGKSPSPHKRKKSRSRSRSRTDDGKLKSSSKKHSSRKRSRSPSPVKPSKRSPRSKTARTRSVSRDRSRKGRSRSHRRRRSRSSRRDSKSRRRRRKDSKSRRKSRRSLSASSSSSDSSRRSRSGSVSRSRSESQSKTRSRSKSNSKTRASRSRSRSASAPTVAKSATDVSPSSND